MNLGAILFKTDDVLVRLEMLLYVSVNIFFSYIFDGILIDADFVLFLRGEVFLFKPNLYDTF